MRRVFACIPAALLLLAAAAVRAPAAGALSPEAIGLLAQVRTAAWTDALAEELGRLSGTRALPARVYDFVIDAVGPNELPPDPADAAAALHAAAGEVDDARRRGTPLPLLRAQTRLAWESSRATGAPFSLRLHQRAQAAVSGFAAGNRRTWDPEYEGRGGSGSTTPGTGPGGRW